MRMDYMGHINLVAEEKMKYDPILRSKRHYETYTPTGRKRGQQPGPKPGNAGLERDMKRLSQWQKLLSRTW